MAASVRIEDEAFGDGRYEHLGALLGTSKYDALGRVAFLWRQCTQEARHVLPESFVAVFVDADKLCESRLGERVPGGIRIRGTRGRIEWLAKLRKNGRKGGRPKKPNGLRLVNQEVTKIEPESNPPAPAPAPTYTERREVKPRAVPVPGLTEARDHFHRRYETAYGTGPHWDGAAIDHVKRLLKSSSLAEFQCRADRLFDSPPKWLKPPFDIGTLVSQWNKLVAPVQARFADIPTRTVTDEDA